MFEKILITNFVLQLLFSIGFILWQFDVYDLDDDVFARLLSALGLLETLILVFSRFIEISKMGKLFLAGFYILQIVMLALQFVFADWGIVWQIKSFLWIIFYIILFMIDIINYPIFSVIFNKINIDVLIKVDGFLKNSWVGSVVKSMFLAGFKMIFDIYGLKEGAD